MKSVRKILRLSLKFNAIVLLACLFTVPAAAMHMVLPIKDVIDRSRFYCDLVNYNYSEQKLYEYAKRNKPVYSLPLSNLKQLITNARRRLPNVIYSLHPINSACFTKAKYLLYLRHIFTVHKLNIDSHILKNIIEYLWVPQEVSISIKDVLYLINGMEMEWLKMFFTIDWDKSREKIEKAVLEKEITQTSIVSSAVLIDILLQGKLIFLNSSTKTYSFNQSAIDLIPKPPMLPHWTLRRFKHIELQCKPKEFIRIVRNHMRLLGIQEDEQNLFDKKSL